MSETLTRAISGIVYVTVLLLACWYSELSFKLLMGVFLVLTTVEFSKLVKFNALAGFILAVSTFYFFGFFNNLGSSPNIAIALVSVFSGIWLIKKLFEPQGLIITSYWAKYMLFLGYIVFGFIAIAKIPMTPEGYKPGQIIGVFVLIWSNDTFAYLVGKSLGKHKLLERISPKKTIEGFIGGMFFTLIFSGLMAVYFLEESVIKWLGIATIVVVFATLGDLIESKFKRSAGVKDSGNIMPGHGGIYDRLDSVIFVAPFVFLYYQFI